MPKTNRGGKRAGSSSGGTFSNSAEFEKSLSGLNDPRLQEYSNAYDSLISRASEINNLKETASNEGLGEWTKAALKGEKESLEKRKKEMPAKKTPSQLGELDAIDKTLEALNNVLSIKPKGKKKKEDVSILA